MLCKVSHKPGHVPLSPRQCSGLSKLPFRDTHTRSRTHTLTDTDTPPPPPPYKVKLSQPSAVDHGRVKAKKTISLECER